MFIDVQSSLYYFLPFFCQLKVGFCLSEELVRKVNEPSAEHEQDDGTRLTATEDGDRKLIFKQDLKVEFSNNTTQVMDIITMTLMAKSVQNCAASPLNHGAAKLRLFSRASGKATVFYTFGITQSVFGGCLAEAIFPLAGAFSFLCR